MASENEKETQAWQTSQIKHGAFQTTHTVPRHAPPVVPPLPKLSQALDRLRGFQDKLEKKKAEYFENLSALTIEVDRIKEKEQKAQEGLNQAGLSFQFAKVELESRQNSTPGTPSVNP